MLRGITDVSDDRATGFDSIFDQVFFAGSGISFWNRQGIPLSSTEVRLTQRASLHPALRSSKEEGHARKIQLLNWPKSWLTTSLPIRGLKAVAWEPFAELFRLLRIKTPRPDSKA